MKTQFITKDHKLYSSKIFPFIYSFRLFRFLNSDEPKSIFSRLIHGFRRREQNQSPPFVFNAQLLSSPVSNLHFQAPRIVTDYGMIESNNQLRASSRSHPHTMRRASLRTHSTDTRQTAPQQILPAPSLSAQMRRPRPRSFSFDEQLSIIDDDDESVAHDMPFSVAPVRPFHNQQQQQQQQQQNQIQHRRMNTSKVSSRCRNRRRRSRSLTKRTNVRPTHPQQQQQHEWLHTTENRHDSTSSEEIDEEDDDDDDDAGENQEHFSPRSTSTAANRPRNRKPILHASDFDRRLCEATTTTAMPANDQENSSPINSENIQHHTSPVSQPSTEPDELNLIVYSTNANELLNATIISRKSETKKISSHDKFLTIRYGSPDSGISGKT